MSNPKGWNESAQILSMVDDPAPPRDTATRRALDTSEIASQVLSFCASRTLVDCAPVARGWTDNEEWLSRVRSEFGEDAVIAHKARGGHRPWSRVYFDLRESALFWARARRRRSRQEGRGYGEY